MEFNFKAGAKRNVLHVNEICIGMRVHPDHSSIYLVIYSEDYSPEYGGVRIHTERYSTSTLELFDVKYFEPICNTPPNARSAQICITDNRKSLVLHKWSDDTLHVYDLETTKNVELYKQSRYSIDKALFSSSSTYYMYYYENLLPELDTRGVFMHHNISDPEYQKIMNVDIIHRDKIRISNNGSVIMGIDKHTEKIVTIWYTHTDKLKKISFDNYITDIMFSSDNKYILLGSFYDEHLSSLYIYSLDDIDNDPIILFINDYCQISRMLDFDYITKHVYRLVCYHYENENNKHNRKVLNVHLDPTKVKAYYEDSGLDVPLKHIFHETTYAAIEESELVVYSCFNEMFKPSTFYKHHHNIQCLAIRVFVIAYKLAEERPDLPQLPTEILLLIISLFAPKDSIKEF